MVTLTVPVASDPGDSPSPDSRFGEFGYVDKTGCWRTVIQIFNNSLHSQSSRRIDPDSTESQRETSRTEVCELLKRITALRKTTANSIRDVWRFTHPLTAAWNNLNPLRDNPALQHWGVLVSDIDNKMLEAAVQHRKELRKKKKGWGLGIIHELNRVGKQSAYRVYKWMSNAIKGGYRFIRVGKTKLNNDEILSKGYKIVDETPEYRLGSTDCQSFTMTLLKAICCSTEGDRTVEEMMENEKLKLAH